MRPIDIRKYKSELRLQSRAARAELSAQEKERLDYGVRQNVRRLREYKWVHTVLIYVSTPIEVDTLQIIKNALADGKKVAVPRCISGTRNMAFHYINGLEDLSPGAFSVLEPSESAPVVTDFSGTLMLVPAFLYDRNGFRLGYGKGYYDRYMANYTGISVGLCYEREVRPYLYHGRYDRAVDFILTEKRIRKAMPQQPRWKTGGKEA